MCSLTMGAMVKALANAYERGWNLVIEGARGPSDLFEVTYTSRLPVSLEDWWKARCVFMAHAHARKFDAAMSLVTLATSR